MQTKTTQAATLYQPRIINLDPTDDPDKVCEAYRQIDIKRQLARAKRHEARLAEKRRKAIAKAEAEAKEKLLAERKLAKEKKVSSAVPQVVIDRRKQIEKRLLAGERVYLQGSAKDLIKLSTDMAALTKSGINAVLISMQSKVSADKPTPFWMIDNFKRLDKAIKTKDDLKSALLTGFLVGVSDVDISTPMTNKWISEIKADGVQVCIAKNRRVCSKMRGWVVPSAVIEAETENL